MRCYHTTADPSTRSPRGGSASICDAGDRNPCREADISWPAGPEDDIAGLPPESAKYKSCGALWTCGVANCGSNPGPTCLSNCLHIASTSVVTAFLDTTKCAVHTCADKICVDPGNPGCIAECMWSRCLGFAVACNAPPQTTGALSCGSALKCLTPCQGEMGCLSQCFASMDAPAQIAFMAYWSCLATSDAPNANVACYDKALGCGASGQSGKLDCYGVLQCSGTCGSAPADGEFDCNADCYAQGSPLAQTQFEQVVSYYTGFARGEGVGQCADTLQTCVAPQGDLTCPEIDPCRTLCKQTGKSDGVCTFECLRRSTQDEAHHFLASTLCATVTCKQACAGSTDAGCQSACVATTCSAEAATCLGQ